MTHATDPIDPLKLKLASLIEATRELRVSEEARVNILSEEIREAEAWEMRRAARNERDRACYRIGSAFEPAGGLHLDDIFLCGLDHLGIHGVLLLADVAKRHPTLPLSALMSHLFQSEAGDAIRDWGVWRRWNWLAELYKAETETFLASTKGRDPKQGWRRQKVTARQEHLVREISRFLQIARPSFSDRGAAFDWIRDAGGNPRFRNAPPCPPLPAPGDW